MIQTSFRALSRALLLTGAAALALAACRDSAPPPDALVAAESVEDYRDILADVDFVQEVSDLEVDPSVTYGVLDNGMRYALRSNDTPSGTAALRFHINAGSIDEADDERGIAHFLEHMAFNGSDAFPEGELVKSLERLGLAFGADTNAYTSFDETVYTLALPSTDDEVVEAALGAMRETASKLTLDADAIERERGVVLSELRTGKSPARTAGEKRRAFYSEGTLFPDRLPIGTEDSIASVTAEQFRDFYDGRYRPENATLVMVGDFDVTAMETRIRELFADWQGVGEALPIARPDSVPELAPRVGIHIDPEVTTNITASLASAPDLRLDTVETRRERMLDGIGNALLNRRLGRLAQGGEADFLGASASRSSSDLSTTVAIAASSQAGQSADALAQAVVELRKALEFGFTDAELAEWKANTRNALERSVETADTRRTAGLASGIMGALDREGVYTTPESGLERYAAYEDEITLDEVERRFRSQWEGLEDADLYLQDSVAPNGGEAEVRSAYDAALAVPVEADADRAAGEFAYTDWGTPGEVVATRQVEDIDYHEVDFANGVCLNHKRTDYAKDQVSVAVTLGAGTFHMDDVPEGFGYMASSALGAGGLEAHSTDDLRTLLAGRTAGARLAVGSETSGIGGGSDNADFPLLMDLMAASLLHQGYRPEAKRNFDRSIDSVFESIDSTPGGVASRDLPRILTSGDTRFGIPEKGVLKARTLEEVEMRVEPLLASAPIEIAVVGDITLEAAIEQVARTFGALPERPVESPDYDEGLRQLTFPDTREIALEHAGDADNALLQVIYPAFDGSDLERTRRAQMAVAVARLKLTDVLREREGQSYSPGVSGYFPELYDDYGYVTVGVTVSPGEVDAVEALIEEVAAEMRAGEITEDEFDRAIRPVRESVETSLESNGYWIGVIGQARLDPDTLDQHRTRVEAYQNMTVDDIRPVARTIFQPDDTVRVVILPEG